MLPGFPIGNGELNSSPWTSWFSKLRNQINLSPVLQSTNASQQTLTSVLLTQLNLGEIDINVNSNFGNDQYITSVTGIYDISFKTKFFPAAVGVLCGVSIFVMKNGAVLSPALNVTTNISAAATTNTITLATRSFVKLTKGDIITMSGQLMNTSVNTTLDDLSLAIRFVQ